MTKFLYLSVVVAFFRKIAATEPINVISKSNKYGIMAKLSLVLVYFLNFLCQNCRVCFVSYRCLREEIVQYSTNLKQKEKHNKIMQLDDIRVTLQQILSQQEVAGEFLSTADL